MDEGEVQLERKSKLTKETSQSKEKFIPDKDEKVLKLIKKIAKLKDEYKVDTIEDSIKVKLPIKTERSKRKFGEQSTKEPEVLPDLPNKKKNMDKSSPSNFSYSTEATDNKNDVLNGGKKMNRKMLRKMKREKYQLQEANESGRNFDGDDNDNDNDNQPQAQEFKQNFNKFKRDNRKRPDKFNKRDCKNSKNFNRDRFDRGKQNKRGLMELPEEVEKRLVELRKNLFKDNLDVEEIKKILRKERRMAENSFKKDLANACYRCRKPGHRLSECPEVAENMDNLTDVCFKCGSAEHKLSECKSKKKELEYVSCFICNEKGHLSRNCPKNTRGIYPKGGSCKICESINHLAKDCPEAEENGYIKEEEITLGTLDTMESADAEITTMDNKIRKKPKIVKF